MATILQGLFHEVPFPHESDPDHPRSVITLAQIETFLALVEEGGVARAAERLGVGRSTVSAHAKAIADEIGHHHFRRQQGGQIVTDTGLEAYGQLRALLLQATFAFEHFRSANPRTQHSRPRACRSAFLAARSIAFSSGRRDASSASACCRLFAVPPTTSWAFPIWLGRRYRTVADRWLLIRSAPHSAGGRPTTLAKLADSLHAPRLPAALRPSLAALAEEANAPLDPSEASLPEVLVEIGKSPKAIGIVPASLFNPGLLDATLEVAVLESTHFDPAIRVASLEHPEIAHLLREELEAILRERLAQPGTRQSRPSLARALPLKYCRSFLALYEEANVGRAAERLSIVQPALTVQLHRIEEEAGCSLFARSHHGLRANERADTLYRLLRPLVASFATTLRHLRASADKSAVPIRIGLMPALDDESLMSQGFVIALDRWSRRHADDVLQVMEGYSGTLVRWLQNGAVDFALVDRMFADPDLLLEPIVEDKMAVVIAAGSDLLSPGPVPFRLAGLPLVLPSTRHGLRTLLAQSLHKRTVAQPRIEVDSMAGCLNMVKIGRYATLLPLGSVERAAIDAASACTRSSTRRSCVPSASPGCAQEPVARPKPNSSTNCDWPLVHRTPSPSPPLPGIFMARRASLHEPGPGNAGRLAASLIHRSCHEHVSSRLVSRPGHHDPGLERAGFRDGLRLDKARHLRRRRPGHGARLLRCLHPRGLSAVPYAYKNSMDFYLKHAVMTPKFDPVMVTPYLIAATKHLGLAPTLTTTFYPPWLLARSLSTLDHYSTAASPGTSSPRPPMPQPRTTASKSRSSTICATTWPTSSSSA